MWNEACNVVDLEKVELPKCDGVVVAKRKPTYEELKKSLEELEKAFDKACNELESLDYKLKMKESLPFSYDCDYTNAEEWKKELLK